MTNIAARKQRFAQTGNRPAGLVSRGSKALGEEECSNLLQSLGDQVPSERSWQQIRILRESTMTSPLRSNVLKLAIETSIVQNRPETASTIRSLLEIDLQDEERDLYQKLQVVALARSGNIQEAISLKGADQLRRWVASVVEHDFATCVSITNREKSPLLKTLMAQLIPQLLEHTILTIERAFRVTSRSDILDWVRQFATTPQA